jgi:hypothetical protein
LLVFVRGFDLCTLGAMARRPTGSWFLLNPERSQSESVAGHTISSTFCGKLRRKRFLNRVP